MLLPALRRAAVWLLLLSFVPAAAWAEEAQTPSKSRRVKQWIRAQVVDDAALAPYGLKLDAACRSCLKENTAAPLVILLHGYNSKSASNADFAAALRAHELPCATFCYPNDQPLADSAKLLARELKSLRQKHPERSVALVTHSMGGLVARACIEDPALDPRNVDKLIMIAPPTRGTLLAHFAYGNDLCEHFLKLRGGGPLARVRASIIDGLGEAVDDLKPGSPFLTELHARERNPRVAYTVFLGTGGKIYGWEMDLARRMIRYSAKIPFLRDPVEGLDAMLRDMDEVMAGHGDGVVAIKRGYLRGVRDTVVYPFEHVSVTGAAETEEIAEVHEAVLARLLTSPEAP